MGLPKMLGYSVQNTLLLRCVRHAIDKNVVVIGEEYAPPLGRNLQPRDLAHLGLWYLVRASGSLDQAGALA